MKEPCWKVQKPLESVHAVNYECEYLSYCRHKHGVNLDCEGCIHNDLE